MKKNLIFIRDTTWKNALSTITSHMVLKIRTCNLNHLELHWKISKRKNKNLSNSFKIDLKVLKSLKPRKIRTSSKVIMKLSIIIDLAPVSRLDFSNEKVHLQMTLSTVRMKKENLWSEWQVLGVVELEQAIWKEKRKH